MVELVVPSDPEKAVTDYLAGLTVVGGPLAGWEVGTRTPENQTPDHAIKVRQIDGFSPNALLYRYTVQFRVWDKSEYVAKRYSNLVIAYLRRGLGAHPVSLPVPLPDPVDPGRMFYQFSVLLPTIGEAP